jgi:diguanylate cyclase (GGDEF)-like protein/PAS domain S-box-containing protein
MAGSKNHLKTKVTVNGQPLNYGRRKTDGKNLQENEQRYQNLLEHLPVGIYRTTNEGRIIEANQTLAYILGYQNTADLWQVNVNNFYIKRKARRDHMNRLAATLTDFSEFELRVKGGKTIWVRDYPRAVLGPDGRIQYYDGILVDITERKMAEQALLQSEKDYRQLFENAHDAIMIFTIRDEIILEANHRACELYGFDRPELIGMSLEKLSKDIAGGKIHIKRTLKNKVFQHFETIHFRRDGSEMILEINAATVKYKGQAAILSINRDITRRKLLEETIRKLAYHDPLTGLPNRILFHDRLLQALAHAKRRQEKVTLFFLDLDGFKELNDSMGHNSGDELLRMIAERLKKQLRASDTVARMGGDEFLILLTEAGHPRETGRIANKILREIRRPYLIFGRPWQITASIGIVIFPKDGRNAESLLKKADLAMYKAKAAGKNNFKHFQARQKQ